MSNTLDETRDWFAERDGWLKPGTLIKEGPGRYKKSGTWQRLHDDGKYRGYGFLKSGGGHVAVARHPYPPTRDGAAAAMPEGWFWVRDGAAVSHRQDGLLLKWKACQRGADNWRIVETPDTGDEIADRYALARLACEAMDKSKEGT